MVLYSPLSGISALELFTRYQLFQIHTATAVNLIRVVSKFTKLSVRSNGSTLLSDRLVHSSFDVGFLLLVAFCVGEVKVIITVIGGLLSVPLSILLVILVARLALGRLAFADLAWRFSQGKAFGEMTEMQVFHVEEFLFFGRMGRVGSNIGGKGIPGQGGVLEQGCRVSITRTSRGKPTYLILLEYPSLKRQLHLRRSSLVFDMTLTAASTKPSTKDIFHRDLTQLYLIALV